MDVAQIYMLAVRSSLVPIAGESWAATPFQGQVELEGWSWDLYNAEVKVENDLERSEASEKSSKLAEDASKGISESFQKARDKLADQVADKEKPLLIAKLEAEDAKLRARTARGEKLPESAYRERDALNDRLNKLGEDADARLRGISDELGKAKSKAEKDIEDFSKKGEKAISKAESIAQMQAKNFEFSFRKRVDISTTQLLNCLKSGDKLKTVTLTMHQSSSNTPWILIFTLTGVRLKDYKIRVDSSDTMTDMKEEWTAEFESFGYVYQNRPHAGKEAAVAGHVNTAAARLATQATVRVFSMMPRRGDKLF